VLVRERDREKLTEKEREKRMQCYHTAEILLTSLLIFIILLTEDLGRFKLFSLISLLYPAGKTCVGYFARLHCHYGRYDLDIQLKEKENFICSYYAYKSIRKNKMNYNLQ